MDFGLDKKHAFVAAASRGLGFAAALELAREGANVTICGRKRATIEAAAAKIRQAASATVFAVKADVAVASEIENAIVAAQQKFGPVEILVTNAGGPPPGFFADISEENWQRGFELTLMSTVRLIRTVLPDMKKQNWGRIVNITSVSVKQPIQGLFLSNALRPGIIGMAKSLADELAPHSITINNVCPGWTDTERVGEILRARTAVGDGSLADEMQKITQSIPMGRMGKPAELAATIAFLCSVRASYITGVSIQIDGGAFRGLM